MVCVCPHSAVYLCHMQETLLVLVVLCFMCMHAIHVRSKWISEYWQDPILLCSSVCRPESVPGAVVLRQSWASWRLKQLPDLFMVIAQRELSSSGIKKTIVTVPPPFLMRYYHTYHHKSRCLPFDLLFVSNNKLSFWTKLRKYSVNLVVIWFGNRWIAPSSPAIRTSC